MQCTILAFMYVRLRLSVGMYLFFCVFVGLFVCLSVCQFMCLLGFLRVLTGLFCVAACISMSTGFSLVFCYLVVPVVAVGVLHSLSAI